MTSSLNKKNRIPSITKDRLDDTITSNARPTSSQEQQVYAFLKGKESVQPLTTRIPKELYSQFRKIAFDKNLKMNQIIIDLIKDYTKKQKTNSS